LLEAAPEVQDDLVTVKVDGGHHLLARHLPTLVADHVGEDLTALALPDGAHPAQILVHVVRVPEAHGLPLDDARNDVLLHRVRPGVVEEVVRDLLHLLRVAHEVFAQRAVGLRHEDLTACRRPARPRLP
jgi:hypothetical protein